MTAVSVIVPVYNVKKYLNKCVESILNQTFKNYEIILVDDGSTDGSGKICDEYAGSCENIKVVHKTNEGVASARNRGLEESTGEMITFVDADDWIDRRYLEVLYRFMKTEKADLVISGGIDVLEQDRVDAEKRKKRNVTKGEVVSKSEAYRRILLCRQNISVVAWAKMYHKKLFKDVRYPAGKVSEDSGIIDKIIENCNKIVCTSYTGYYHLRRKGSLMHSKMSPAYRAGMKNAERLWIFMKEKYPDIEDAAKIFYYSNCIQLVNFMVLDNGEKYKRECKKIRRKILKEAKFLIFSKDTKLEEKGAVVCLLFGIPLYEKIWRMYLRVSGKHSGTAME